MTSQNYQTSVTEDTVVRRPGFGKHVAMAALMLAGVALFYLGTTVATPTAWVCFIVGGVLIISVLLVWYKLGDRSPSS